MLLGQRPIALPRPCVTSGQVDKLGRLVEPPANVGQVAPALCETSAGRVVCDGER
jgi:hypothetical protein